ncbi:MAG TPA: [Fe-Fe] hydrogenase large subunit C-terminal domain-containing protein, partial [Bacteroidales bacterium]|nr:[Fe-Fe] hydrogenase large subunit C-terminal domain-containing protein [Bacteroidales bacterium]
ITCGQCIMVCPTGALHEKDDVNKVLLALQDPDKYVVVQISPTVSVSLAEEFNIRFGKELDELLVATLRRMGFNKVFKTAFAADIMLIQMAEELIDRMEKNERLPILSSNCPAFVKYIEQTYPDLIPNLSVIKSPQQIMGSLVKHHFAKDQKVKAEKIFSVSLMPCTAAKFEASREEFTHKGNSDIDVTLTTRELARMIRLYGLNIQQLAPEVSDTPFVIRTSASKIIGTSGGLAEALYRTLYYKLTGKQLINFKIAALRGNKKIKEYNSKIGNHKIGIAAVNGLSNAVELLDKIIEGKSAYQFIEVMACPGSCVNGGGQPIGSGQEAIKARIKTLYDIDEKESVKASYKNMAVTELFDKYIDKEKESFFQQFITSYQKRDVML